MTRRERKAAERRERATEKKFKRWLQMLELRYQLTGEEYSLVDPPEPDEADEELLAEQALGDSESDDDSGGSMGDSESETSDEESDEDSDEENDEENDEDGANEDGAEEDGAEEDGTEEDGGPEVGEETEEKLAEERSPEDEREDRKSSTAPAIPTDYPSTYGGVL